MKVSDIINISGVQEHNRRIVAANQKAYDAMYDVTDVVRGYRYFQRILLEKAIAIYQYDGLPDTIPQHEIELLLMTLGRCIFVDDKKHGLVVLPVNFSGVGVYTDQKPDVLWATPLISGQGKRTDYAVGFNNSTHIGLGDTIDRYSRLLADVESTMSNYIYILRKPSIAAAPDQNSADSYNAALIANRLGQNSCVLDDPVIGNVQMLPVVQNLSHNQLTEICDAREKVLRMFLAEIGVQYADAKRERQSVDEIHVNTQALIINSVDMLDARKKMCDELNRKHGLNVSVRINPAYDISAYSSEGVTADDNFDDRNEQVRA